MNPHSTDPGTPGGEHTPQAPPAMPGTPPHGAAPENSFFAWIRQLGIRRSADRWIGGVAGGIARRTGLDPVLVRGLVIVLSIFGIGVVLYGVAWALLPEPDGRIHLEEAVRGTWTAGMTGALVFTVLGLSGPGISFWANDGWLGSVFWGLFWVAAVVLGIYWLTTRNNGKGTGAGSPPAGPPADAAQGNPPANQPHMQGFSSAGSSARMTNVPPDESSQAAGAGPAGPRPAGYPGPEAPTMPLSFGAHAAPAAGQETGPSAPSNPDFGGYYAQFPPPGKEPKTVSYHPPASWIALICGFALLAAGVLLALDYSGIYVTGSPVTVAVAAAGVVLGLGIVGLGAAGRSSGLAGGLGVLTLVAALLFNGSFAYRNLVVANQSNWSASQSGTASEGYSVAAADGNLDLRGLAGELGDGDITVPVSVAAGDLSILVPADVPVSVYSEMALGNVELEHDGRYSSAGGLWVGPQERQLNPGARGNRIIIEIKGVASNVLVTTDESSLDR
ncbi:PspC domain-containing protein [Arthrobacter gandavensis]|uniref:PspC domain-containing protein n=1 Tax=Arthrobacter gandavensis TaxID=169960 RepID=UPI00188E4DF8|nr:PspC domain-containing protein [Arthrobacter gandavensis]MBF4993925.1 PspC domain-containing protein [Arthrobacter gandavensis]